MNFNYKFSLSSKLLIQPKKKKKEIKNYAEKLFFW
jgi:hypothetical protein